MSSEKVSTLTIRLTAEEAAKLEALKMLTGKTTGSEALKYVMREYPRVTEFVREREKQRAEQERELQRIQRALRNYTTALRELEAAALRE